MKSARRGSEVGASEFCVSGSTTFFNRRKASWKRFVSSCSNPLRDPPPQRGSEKRPPPYPPPQAGEGKARRCGGGEKHRCEGAKSNAPTLPSPASGGGKGNCAGGGGGRTAEGGEQGW